MRHFHLSFRQRGNAMKRPAALIWHHVECLTADERECSPSTPRKVQEMTLIVCLESGLKVKKKKTEKSEKIMAKLKLEVTDSWQSGKKLLNCLSSPVDSMGCWRPWNACPIVNPWSSSCKKKKRRTWKTSAWLIQLSRAWSLLSSGLEMLWAGKTSLSCNLWKTGKLNISHAARWKMS